MGPSIHQRAYRQNAIQMVSSRTEWFRYLLAPSPKVGACSHRDASPADARMRCVHDISHQNRSSWDTSTPQALHPIHQTTGLPHRSFQNYPTLSALLGVKQNQLAQLHGCPLRSDSYISYVDRSSSNGVKTNGMSLHGPVAGPFALSTLYRRSISQKCSRSRNDSYLCSAQLLKPGLPHPCQLLCLWLLCKSIECLRVLVNTQIPEGEQPITQSDCQYGNDVWLLNGKTLGKAKLFGALLHYQIEHWARLCGKG